MFSVIRKCDIKTTSLLVRCYSVTRKSHYEVLNLQRNCSDKQIKDAFIKKSKQYHPDKNKDAMAQDTFVRIVEAYNVLGKPSTRAQYDRMSDLETSYVYKTHTPYNIRKNQYSYSYSNTYSNAYNNEFANAYYPKKNTGKKIPNIYIIMLCFGVALIGTIIQMIIIREIYTEHQRQSREKTKILAEELERVRASAKGNGNDLQTKILLEKIVAAANPTVATASLGQALANEKK